MIQKYLIMAGGGLVVALVIWGLWASLEASKAREAQLRQTVEIQQETIQQMEQSYLRQQQEMSKLQQQDREADKRAIERQLSPDLTIENLTDIL